MIDCRTTEAKLGRFVDGELPPTEWAAVESHIQACSRCRDELATLRALSTRLDGLTVPPVPETLAAGVMWRVRGETPDTRSSFGGVFKFWKEWPAAMRIAACATAMVACVAGAALSGAVAPRPMRTDAEMSWVGLASGAPIAYAYGETSR